MPHYLIRGAWKRDAVDAVRAVFAKSEDSARSAASKAGLLVLSVEAVDKGAAVREDAGGPSALSRLATQLNRDGRPDDAAAVMLQVYGMRAHVGTGDSLCLRIPRYYLKAGRHDDAWRVLNEIRVGRVRGNSLIDKHRYPSDWTEWYRLAGRVLKADKRTDQQLVYETASKVLQVLDDWLRYRDGVRGVTISSREDAVASIASIVAGVLHKGSDASHWSESVTPRSEDLCDSQVCEIGAVLDSAILSGRF